MIIGNTPVPKREIIELIMRTFPTETVQAFLKIKLEEVWQKSLVF